MRQRISRNTAAMKSILGSFYGVHSKQVSEPHLVIELRFDGTSCDQGCSYSERCCSINVDSFGKCVTLIDINKEEIQQFLLGEAHLCLNGRLPWEKKFRLYPYEHGIPAMPPGLDIELGRLLVICLLTPSYRYAGEQGEVAWSRLRTSFGVILSGEVGASGEGDAKKVLNCLYQEDFVPDNEHKMVAMLSEALELYEEDRKRRNVAYRDWKVLLPPNKEGPDGFVVKRRRKNR